MKKFGGVCLVLLLLALSLLAQGGGAVSSVTEAEAIEAVKPLLEQASRSGGASPYVRFYGEYWYVVVPDDFRLVWEFLGSPGVEAIRRWVGPTAFPWQVKALLERAGFHASAHHTSPQELHGWSFYHEADKDFPRPGGEGDGSDQGGEGGKGETGQGEGYSPAKFRIWLPRLGEGWFFGWPAIFWVSLLLLAGLLARERASRAS